MQEVHSSGGWVADFIMWACGGIAALFLLLIRSLWTGYRKEIEDLKQAVETQRIETANHIKAVYERISALDERSQDRHIELLKLLPRGRQ